MGANENLHQLDENDLAERLIEIARTARKLADQGQVVELADLLASVKAAADDADGVKLALLEVGEAFLRAISRSDLGKTEMTLRRFVLSQPDGGELLLASLADGGSIEAESVKALGSLGQDLVDVGVLRSIGGDRFDLRPSLRTLARDLVEPAVFRAWRRVNHARGLAALGRMKNDQAAAFLAGEFGVTQQQAERHLKHSPLSGEASSQQGVAPICRRDEMRIVYSRSGRGESPSLQQLVVDRSASTDQADVARDATVMVAAGTRQQGPWS